ncbi:MAG: hypothetical protein ACRDBQ_18860 [Shewanella sp.]
MDNLDFSQLDGHNFDLGVRESAVEDQWQKLANDYGHLLDDRLGENVTVAEFEAVLVRLINQKIANQCLLTELNLHKVNPVSAKLILDNSVIPNDTVMELLDEARGKVIEATSEYRSQLEDTDLTFEDQEDLDRCAKYVVASVLVDDREDEEL